MAKPCSIEGCTRPLLARGWCATHYARWRTTGEPGTNEPLRRAAVPGQTEKPCTNCKVTKPLDEFYTETRNVHLRMSLCKICFTERNQIRRRKRLYNLDHETYMAAVERAGGRCNCCGLPTERLVVDHDHATGLFRDLLCDRCNRILGAVNDDPNILQAAIRYLSNHS